MCSLAGCGRLTALFTLAQVVLAEGAKSERRALGAFLMPNKPTERTSVGEYAVPLAAVEQATGLRFFPHLDRRVLAPLCTTGASCDYAADTRIQQWYGDPLRCDRRRPHTKITLTVGAA